MMRSIVVPSKLAEYYIVVDNYFATIKKLLYSCLALDVKKKIFFDIVKPIFVASLCPLWFVESDTSCQPVLSVNVVWNSLLV